MHALGFPHNFYTTHTFFSCTLIAKGQAGLSLAPQTHTHVIVWMSLCIVCVRGGVRGLCGSAAFSAFFKCSLVIQSPSANSSMSSWAIPHVQIDQVSAIDFSITKKNLRNINMCDKVSVVLHSLPHCNKHSAEYDRFALPFWVNSVYL